MRPTPTLQTRNKIRNSLKGRGHSAERIEAITRGRRIKYPVIEKGNQFSDWTVVGDPICKHNQMQYLCRCVCGEEKHVAASHLRLGKSSKCIKCNGKSNSARAFTRNKSEDGRWIYKGGNGVNIPWLAEVIREFSVKQEGKCALCLRLFKPDMSDACIDHDHETLLVRGLLHRGCNVFMGFVDRYPGITDRVVEYLEGAK